MEKVAELLERAADALESGRITWAQYARAIKFPVHGLCAVETLDAVALEMMAQMDWRDRCHVIGKADVAVSMHVTKGREGFHLTSWNDAKARTLGEVVEAFKETAKEIRNQQPPEAPVFL